jgi:PadR family transcriptional regulator PadR
MSFNRDLNKGSAELLVLTLLEGRPRHGYDIGKLIEERSGGQIRFRIGSLYPILFRLEDRGLIAGRWLEKDGERRRRCYRLTPAGRKFLESQRNSWEQFVATVNRIVRPSHA